jgi:hypothetical protein
MAAESGPEKCKVRTARARPDESIADDLTVRFAFPKPRHAAEVDGLAPLSFS